MEKNNPMNHDPTRCAICSIELDEGLHHYFCAVCRQCDRKAVNTEHFEAGHVSAVPREDVSVFLTDDGDNPVFIEGIRCWRRYRFGGYITMRDWWDSPDLESFYENMEESRKDFNRLHTGKTDGSINGIAVKDYVYSKISFKLNDNIYAEIDSIIGETWQRSGDDFNKHDVIRALDELKDESILLPQGRLHEVVDLIFEYLVGEGHIEEV